MHTKNRHYTKILVNINSRGRSASALLPGYVDEFGKGHVYIDDFNKLVKDLKIQNGDTYSIG